MSAAALSAGSGGSVEFAAIVGEDQVIGMRYRTDEDRLILPTALPSESRAVWHREGRCEDVLAELFELPEH